MRSSAGDRWRTNLSQWAIPQEILDQAPEDPWIHPPALFQIPENISDSISHARAREVLQPGSTVLDIGCGGGIAAFALTPPATDVIGVDHQPEMLEMFRANALARGVTSEVFEGFWPALASQVPMADVAVAHHVVYNVQEIEDFLLSMNDHAKKRVVLELPQRHPLSTSAPLWKHFWNLDRPIDPTPGQLVDVLAEIGISAHLELWSGPMRTESSLEQLAHYSRIRLCLPASREVEVLEFHSGQPQITERQLATIWWDCE